jgi:ectoine hydroxylase-related dioxygenase (phytanoyl-CoA dioxygenase family)
MENPMSILKRIANKLMISEILSLRSGLHEYNKSGNTPPNSYQSMIKLFCKTQGYSNDLLHFLIKSPKIKFSSAKGTLGDFSKDQVINISKIIKEKGYFIFENGISDEVGNYLYNLACSTESFVRPMSNEGLTQDAVYSKFDPKKQPLAIRYDYAEEFLINDPIVQSIMTDLSILSISQEYLGGLPKADITGMWWHTDYSNEPNQEAATMWHFDMDRVKWLKFFFYLTDVNTESGPHCFIEGSHKTRGIPKKLLSHGYARLTDEDIDSYYPKSKYIEYNAKKFTVIAEDTRGLHKGKPVLNGSRLLFQFTLSDHMFGGYYSSRKIKKFANPEIENFIKSHNGIYERYL